MELWTAFILGLAGSAHCAGMCGPLALALPGAGAGPIPLFGGRLLYNLGRLVTYGLLGVLFGLVGRSLALAGVQRWVAIGLGVVLLAGVLFSRNLWGTSWGGRLSGWLRPHLGRLLRRGTPGALFGFGLLNGLLPCGLVYVACFGAAALGDLSAAVAYMLVFGLGTVPMMLALGLAGRLVPVRLRLRLQRLVPLCVGLVAVLLILRGLSLGIPYVSPDISGADPAECCLPPTDSGVR
ncbi:MAG: sulfite exporter TauE/SafE family protein [Verrucomicrobiales bacterium]|nr:sulfite exporter TauE/SafE family protein [Verrucomicrobiales bacterium]MCP5526586.1 sulfite exporter TauE/SafE family protein [Verrucomicrobiales bacterium]